MKEAPARVRPSPTPFGKTATEGRPYGAGSLPRGEGFPHRNRHVLLLAAVGGAVAAVGLSASLAGGSLLPGDWRVPGLGADFAAWLLAASVLAFLGAQAVLFVPLVFSVRFAHAWPSASGRAMEATWTALPILLTLALGIWVGWV